ncbi:sigma-70 family RNA polymerase sigma factor [Lapillicoccus sp.]|uniref:sigma-70 family RNA polymerase sigma factor n=1 Tax=Lapillicoccus sp. TaxID=1909287 RepID=UPI00398359D6
MSIPVSRSVPAEMSARETRTQELLCLAGLAPDSAQSETLRAEAVLINRGLALSLSRQYHGRGIDDDDLDQVAMLGLCKAVKGYRARPDKTFAGYAVPTIRGELKRHFRDCGWLVRPTRSVQELGQSIRATVPELTQELGRQPTLGDLAEQLSVTRGAIAEARLADGSFRGASLDAPVVGSSTPLGDTLTDATDDFAAVDSALSLRPAIARLSSREQMILQLRFVEGLTQEQIGASIGVSQMQVSRLITGIISRLRRCLMAEDHAA